MWKEKSSMEPRSSTCLLIGLMGMTIALNTGCAFRQPATTTAQTPVSTAPPAKTSAPPRSAMAPAPSAQWILEKYTDLPIPASFIFNSNKSFVFMQGALRSADLTYDGSMSSSKLIRFYQDSMPANGWQLVRITGMMMKSMTFVKGDERCEITIHTRVADDNNSNLVHTRLHIKLNPY